LNGLSLCLESHAGRAQDLVHLMYQAQECLRVKVHVFSHRWLTGSRGCVSKAVASRIEGFEHGYRTLKHIEWLTIFLTEASGETLGHGRPQLSEPVSRGGSAETEFWKTPYKVLEFKFHIVAEAIQGWPHERVAIVPPSCSGSFLKKSTAADRNPLRRR
jgi:hypothetical protein